MSQRFAIIYEANADFCVATELADRVFVESIDWLSEDLVGHQREWVKVSPDGRPLTWTEIKELARESGIKAHGHFDGCPGKPDAAAARRAILFVRSAFPDLNGIVLVRDQDDQPERRVGLEQARSQYHGGIAIVVGLAIVEREAWVISGFDPQDQVEQALLDAERKALGLDPRQLSHELTACKDENALRSPKRVLKNLCGNDFNRERHCWTQIPLALLAERGRDNGLRMFLVEVKNHLARLIGHVAK